MSTIKRRDFLTSLLGIGAAIAIPFHPSRATAEEIDHAWEEVTQHPTVFHVDEYNTITVPGIKEPEIRSDVYGDSTKSIDSIDDLVHQVESCEPLADYFRRLCNDELDEWEAELAGAGLTSQRRRQLMRWAERAGDPYDGWQEWVRINGDQHLSTYKRLIDDWLADSYDLSEVEWFAATAGGQGAAFQFFQQLPPDTLKRLGVVIVEGDHPGSTYFGAELRVDVGDANRQAAEMGLPIMFSA